MAYKAPGAYARFTKTASTVANAGSSRIMALIGTGINYYEIANETIKRNSDRPYDALANGNVFEIISVSSKPVYATKNTPENVYYKQSTDFELHDGQNIVWRRLSGDINQPELVNVDTDPFINEGSRAFNTNCSYVTDVNNSYFMIDAEYRIEVTYAAQEGGCYRIINTATNELLGEYVCGANTNTAIPGVNLIVKSTYKLPAGAAVDSDENEIAAGDYFLLKTTALKTEIEATAEINSKSSVLGLKKSIKSVAVINEGKVKTGKYKIVIKNALTKEFQVCEIDISSGAEVAKVIYPDATDATATATWAEGNEVYDIIPGVEVILDAFKYTPADNDGVYIDTVARKVDSTLPAKAIHIMYLINIVKLNLVIQRNYLVTMMISLLNMVIMK